MAAAIESSRTMPKRRRRRGISWAIMLSFGWLAVVAFVAVFADVLAPYGYNEQDPFTRFARPLLAGGSAVHPLGTDQIGRDVLSRLLLGMRISLAIALVGTLIGAVLGSVLGAVAAHFRGIVDDTIMALVDMQASLPFVIFAIAALAIFEPGFGTFIVIMGIAGWERYARLMRALVLAANTEGYADALRSIGASPGRIYLLHVVPNVVGSLTVQMTINFPETILLETGLSFLGLGVQPPLASLGLLVADGRPYIYQAWWLTLIPGAAIFMTTLAVSLLGDHVRDRVDAALR